MAEPTNEVSTIRGSLHGHGIFRPKHRHANLAKQAVNGVLSLITSRDRQREGPTVQPRRSRRQAAKLAVKREITTALGKRKRQDMGQTTVQIHEDGQRNGRTHVKDEEMDGHVQLVSDDEDDPPEYSDEATDSDEEPDESVAEDMRKLEENFKGISQRYRLINKIGEGTGILLQTRSSLMM